jgi:hypothetical protein
MDDPTIEEKKSRARFTLLRTLQTCPSLANRSCEKNDIFSDSYFDSITKPVGRHQPNGVFRGWIGVHTQFDLQFPSS